MVIHGDGGIMLSIGELATLAQSRLPVFVAVAGGMGVPAERVADAAGFDRAFAASIERAGPGLIEIDMTALKPMDYPIGPHENVG